MVSKPELAEPCTWMTPLPLEAAKEPVESVAGLLSCSMSTKPPFKVIGRLFRMLPFAAWMTKCPSSTS